MIKINNFEAELTDISAKKAALMQMHDLHASSHVPNNQEVGQSVIEGSENFPFIKNNTALLFTYGMKLQNLHS